MTPGDKSEKTPDRNRQTRDFEKAVASQEERNIRAQHEPRGILFWVGMFGLVGWSIAVPTMLGVAAGIWIDRRWPSEISWTLMLLFTGLILGCLTAWHWIRRESRGGDK